MRGRVHPVPLVLTVLCVLAAVASANLGTDTVVPVPAAEQSGHWVINRATGAALHVHGGTGRVDARVELPTEAARDGLLTVSGQGEGFVVGRDQVWSFDRSTLTVVSAAAAAATEVPVAIEVIGGPYLVYRQAGTVVRLGRPPVVTHAGGPLGPPVRTPDGTVWVHRPDNGQICALRREALELDCSVTVRPGAPGGLTVVDETATFVDAGLDTAQQVLGGALGPPLPLGTDLPDDVLLGDRAAGGRLPVVVPGANELRLVDLRAALPMIVPLGPGTFSAPIVGAEVIALLDLAGGRLLTFTPDGLLRGETPLPPGSTPTGLNRGADGRIYVDESDGARTHVVQPDGTLATVDLGGGSGPQVVAAPPPEQLAPVRPPPAGQVLVPTPDGGVAVGVPGGTSPGAPQPGAPGPVGPQPGPADPGQQLPPPAGAPAAPTGVRATLSGPGQASIQWNPVDGGGLPVSYTVSRSTGGGTVVSGQATAVWPDLAPGTTYTFVVTASNDFGTGPPSAASNAVVIPTEPPGAPTGIVVETGFQGARTMLISPSWQRPDLNGGELVEYQVGITDANGATVVTTTATETLPTQGRDRCLAPFGVEVRAVTRAPGSDQTQTGPPGRAAATAGADCTINIQITGEVAGPDSIQVSYTHVPPGQPQVGSDCQLLVDGTTRWTGGCSAYYDTPPEPIIVGGLAPGVPHEVVMRIEQIKGPPTETNTVFVTIP
jgi:hypothetical protein